MAATSLPIARLLSPRDPIPWHEAVAVVHMADALSAASGAPISLEHFLITTAGEVRLSPAAPGEMASEISSLQLLAALLGGMVSATDFRGIVVAVDTTAPADGGRRQTVDLRWCLSANPKADVSRLATRALAANLRIESDHPRGQTELTMPPTAPAGSVPHAGIEPITTRRRPAIVVRVQRPSPGVIAAMAALLLAMAGGAAAISTFVAEPEWPGPYATPVGTRHVRPLATASR